MPHPWFQPLWRRLLTTLVCLAWLGFELWQGEALWLILAAAFSIYALWDFFLSGNYQTAQDPTKTLEDR